MKKFLLWMFAAVLMCGTSMVFSSCGDDDDDAGTMYKFKCSVEVVDQGDIPDAQVLLVKTMIEKCTFSGDFPNLEIAEEYIDVFGQDMIVFIKSNALTKEGTKYLVHIRVYDSAGKEVSHRILTVEGNHCTLEPRAGSEA